MSVVKFKQKATQHTAWAEFYGRTLRVSLEFDESYSNWVLSERVPWLSMSLDHFGIGDHSEELELALQAMTAKLLKTVLSVDDNACFVDDTGSKFAKVFRLNHKPAGKATRQAIERVLAKATKIFGSDFL